MNLRTAPIVGMDVADVNLIVRARYALKDEPSFTGISPAVRN
jgi:hypothetical protein